MMERFQHEFDDFWKMPSVWSHGLRWKHRFPMIPFRETMMPSVDVEDRGKDFRLTVDVPGLAKKRGNRG
jgi:HSP20 family molecular chaperone IbpA